jgi:hypothetical protein
MNLYKLERTDSCGYDEYDSMIVAAPNLRIVMEIIGGQHLLGVTLMI